MSADEKSRPKQRNRQRETHASKPRDQSAEAQSAEQPGTIRWHEHAAFQIAFDRTSSTAGRESWQTRAYHEEADDQARWPGLARDKLLEWMWRKAELPSSTAAMEQADNSQEAETPAVGLRLDLGDIRLEEAPAERQLGGAEQTKRLSATIDFRIAGAEDQLADLYPARSAIQIMACELTSGALTVLAADQHRLDEALDQQASVDFELPALGHYQLLATVLLPDAAVVGVGLGPRLTVVP